MFHTFSLTTETCNAKQNSRLKATVCVGGTDRLKSEKLTEYLKNTIIPDFRLYGLANMCMNGPLRRISA